MSSNLLRTRTKHYGTIAKAVDAASIRAVSLGLALGQAIIFSLPTFLYASLASNVLASTATESKPSVLSDSMGTIIAALITAFLGSIVGTYTVLYKTRKEKAFDRQLDWYEKMIRATHNFAQWEAGSGTDDAQVHLARLSSLQKCSERV